MSAAPLPATLPRRLPWRTLLALFDQATVSGTNFLTTLLIARACSPADLGRYTLGFTLVVLCLSTQDSLAITPYTILGPRMDEGERRGYAASVLVQQAILAVLAALAVGAASATTAFAGVAMAPVLLGVAVALPAALLREFGRRFAFSRLDPAAACGVDVTTASLQLSLLGLLAWQALLTPLSAHLVAGVACGVAGLGWLLLYRGELSFSNVKLGPAWAQNWDLGRWVLATQMTGVVHGYAVHWLLAARQGPTGAGIFAACLTVVMLTNPLLFGVGNLLAPQAARAFADEGRAGLRRVVLRAMALLGVLMGAFAAAAGLFGEQALTLFYGGKYAGYGPLVFVLALAVLSGALAIPAEHALRAAGMARVSFQCGVFGLVVTVLAASLLSGPYGLTGAAFGYLAGSLASTLSRSWFLWLALRPAGGGT